MAKKGSQGQSPALVVAIIVGIVALLGGLAWFTSWVTAPPAGTGAGQGGASDAAQGGGGGGNFLGDAWEFLAKGADEKGFTANVFGSIGSLFKKKN